MLSSSCRITLHMVCSLDGFIAKKDNSVSWFETRDHYEHGAPEPDPAAFANQVDCYVMGSRTYEHAFELSKAHGWPYGDVPTIVMSSRTLPVERKSVSFFNGSLEALVQERLNPAYSKAWVVGGASLVNSFIRAGLADEIRMVVLPVILGDGLRFFESAGPELSLHLKEAKAYKSAMVDLCYEIRKTSGHE